MPKWNPGMQRGKPVRTQFNMPIKFSLEKKVPKEKENEGLKNETPQSQPEKK